MKNLPTAIKPLVLALSLLSTDTVLATPQHFKLSSNDLTTNLQQLAQQAGITLLFDYQLTQNMSAPIVNGNYELADLFNRLLEDKDLVAITKGKDTWVIHVKDSSAIVLDKAVVYSNQLGTITENSGSYTPGSIATATRMVLTPRETPQSISVITRQKMDDFALTNIDSVIQHTPGVSILTYDSERTEYYARGFAIQNFQYDGIPMTRNSAYSAGNTLTDMAIYDRVEVLKGANGLLTGVGTPGATLNLVRKKPTYENQGHISFGLGSWDTYRTEIDVSGAFNQAGSLRGRFVTANQTAHSWQDRYKKDVYVFYGIVEADLGENTLLTFGADYQDNKPKGSTWGGNPYWDSEGNFNKRSRSFSNAADWSRWEQYTRTVFSTLEHTFDNGWVGKVQLNHQINGYDAKLAALSGGNPNPNTGKGAQLWSGRYDGKTTSDAIDAYLSGFTELFGREHEFVLGASYAKRHWKNTGESAYGYYKNRDFDYYSWQGNIEKPIWENRYHDDVKTYEQGYYATSRLNFTDNFKLILGARLSNYKEQDMRTIGKVTPFIGAMYDVNDTISVYSSYSKIFKPQDAKDINNKTLAPMTGSNYETGIKAEFFDGRLNLQAAYFEIKQDNYAQEYTVDNPIRPYAYKAVKGVKTKGYELEISGALSANWQVQAGFSYAAPKLKGTAINTTMPKTQATLYSSYNFNGELHPLTIGGGLRWQGKTWSNSQAPTGKYNSNGKTIWQDKRFSQKSFFVVDAIARYQLTDNLTVSLNVDNLLNEKYYTMMDFYSVYSWGSPRSYMLTTRYNF